MSSTAFDLGGQWAMPPGVQSLADFRRWALSDEFPESGRIDYINGNIEADMSPEDLFFHATLKNNLIAVLTPLAEDNDRGYLFSDRTRVSCPEANLSVEPDIVFLSEASCASGRVRLVPKSSNAPDRFVELEGPPDLIVEIVSDSSVTKDMQRLPDAYFRAGVSEFWLIDARQAELVFQIHRPGPASYELSSVDDEGFQHSDVMGCRFRLDRHRDSHGRWRYSLLVK